MAADVARSAASTVLLLPVTEAARQTETPSAGDILVTGGNSRTLVLCHSWIPFTCPLSICRHQKLNESTLSQQIGFQACKLKEASQDPDRMWQILSGACIDLHPSRMM